LCCFEDIKYGADLSKFCATAGVLSKGDNAELQQYSDVTTLEKVKVVLKGGEVIRAIRVEGREAEVKR
jgi:hypothetical protein